jgi:small-conductance mechanosensitive channel
VFIWAGLFFFSLREWKVTLSGTSYVEGVDVARKVSPLKWLLLRLSWLVWGSIVILSLVFSWGGSQAILVGLLGFLTQPIQVGNINLKLVGFVYATIMLLCTHTAARLLRRILRDRILSGSGMELGLQESVTTIIIYLFWGLGILLTLNVLGLSATSIAVAFGALSIGLGFGLQNIFNNFVSGLILLFERPIQVGDVVQVDTIWGIVTKINVRSTVVQTFDNASLIIPNSDMISKQVTNWSFKDQRIRRNIIVGVAYGSNIDLVRDTLLEIAKGHPKILKRPKADVLFQDFGDSALLFRLRLWTTIEHFVDVETDVRFAIDRLFRERKIEIAFPQRDIHIRSTVEKEEKEKQNHEAG